MTDPLNTYEGFTAALERRPENISPLAWLAALENKPPEASAWIVRWLREKWARSSDSPERVTN